MGFFKQIMKLLPKKRIDITELEWEKERLRKRLAAEEAARGVTERAREAEPEAEDPNQEYEILEREILPERIVCPSCGNITFEGVERCDRCGKELY